MHPAPAKLMGHEIKGFAEAINPKREEKSVFLALTWCESIECGFFGDKCGSLRLRQLQ
jgi:hypothetical protein